MDISDWLDSIPQLSDPDQETVEQLQEMLELLDLFPGIRQHSIDVIGDWLDHNSPEGSAFKVRARKESAALIIDWLRDQIGIPT
jgi:hypothetical protein